MTQPSRTLRVADFCAGTGGFSLAFERTERCRTVFATDFEKASKTIYDDNHSTEMTLADITKIDPESLPEFDILTAGFPCQPFSIAGKRSGLADARSEVIWAIDRIIKARKPRCFVLENVKMLLTHDHGRTFETIKNTLSDEGEYQIFAEVINTCTATPIPQNRARLFIVGVRRDINLDNGGFEKEFGSLNRSSASTTSLHSIAQYLQDERYVDERYYYKEGGVKRWDVLKANVVECVDKDVVYQLRRTYVRENQSGVCPTLTKQMGTGGNNAPIILTTEGRIRRLTPRECFNLQGFPPETYVLPASLSDSKLYQLAGNAVTLGVVARVAELVVRNFFVDA